MHDHGNVERLRSAPKRIQGRRIETLVLDPRADLHRAMPESPRHNAARRGKFPGLQRHHRRGHEPMGRRATISASASFCTRANHRPGFRLEVIRRKIHPAGHELDADARIVHPFQTRRVVDQRRQQRHPCQPAADLHPHEAVVCFDGASREWRPRYSPCRSRTGRRDARACRGSAPCRCRS